LALNLRQNFWTKTAAYATFEKEPIFIDLFLFSIFQRWAHW